MSFTVCWKAGVGVEAIFISTAETGASITGVEGGMTSAATTAIGAGSGVGTGATGGFATNLGAAATGFAAGFTGVGAGATGFGAAAITGAGAGTTGTGAAATGAGAAAFVTTGLTALRRGAGSLALGEEAVILVSLIGVCPFSIVWRRRDLKPQHERQSIGGRHRLPCALDEPTRQKLLHRNIFYLMTLRSAVKAIYFATQHNSVAVGIFFSPARYWLLPPWFRQD